MLLDAKKFTGQRLDKAISDWTKTSRSVVQNMIKTGNTKKNGMVFTDISYKIKDNDIIEFTIPQINLTLEPKQMDLDIVYEDTHLLVVNKPAGLTVHPNGYNDKNTLVNILLNLYGENLSHIGGEFRPGIVHRLDKDTSGLMIVAKNDEAHENLSQQLKDRRLSRNYIGIVWGVLNPRNGIIDGYIKRNGLRMGMTKETESSTLDSIDTKIRFSSTNYKTIATYLDNSLSMVEFKLDTGRTHQIRVHCNSKNCPLVGDKMYGGNARHLKNIYQAKNYLDNFPRQALHSYKISFYQPITNEFKNFEVPLSNDILELINNIEIIQ